MVKLENRWRSDLKWLESKDGRLVLKDDAPEELKESYRIYCEQLERVRKREKELNAKIL